MVAGGWRGGGEDGVDVGRMWVLAPGWIGAAGLCWVCCDAGGTRAGAAVLTGERSQRISLKMLPVGGGAGAGPPGAARRMTRQSPQHQGHLVTGAGYSAGGAAARGARGAVRGAGRGARRGAAVQPTGRAGWGRWCRWFSPTGCAWWGR